MNKVEKSIDCVLIGCNSTAYNENYVKLKPYENVSANYFDIKMNSILRNGKRYDFMEYLNKIINDISHKELVLNTFELPNLAVIYLNSFLKKKNINCAMINYFNKEKEKLKELLLMNPRSVAITTTYYTDMGPIIELIDFIKKYNKETKIIVGGPFIFSESMHYAKLMFKEVLKQIDADIFIVESQGEQALRAALTAIKNDDLASLATINNIAFRDENKEIVITEKVKEENDLNENMIDWSLVPKEVYTPTVLLRTARGCPFCCAFCNYHVISKHTLMDLKMVENELNYLHDNGVRNILFIDDTFNVPINRFKELCRMMIKNEYNFKWVSFLRCANADDEVFTLMKESGCIGVFLGIESGSQTILNNMNKFADTKRYMHAITKLNELKIITYGSFIVGFPGETKETIMETLDFINKSKLTFYNLEIYFHDTIAPINERKDEFEIKGQTYRWKHKTMDWKEACNWIEYLYKNIEYSTPISLEGFGLWAVPYLMEIGVPQERIIPLVQILGKMMIESLDDVEKDFTNYDNQIIELLKDIEF